MSILRTLLPSGRWLWVLDAVMAAWTVTWVVLGFAIAAQVHGLRQLSGTVVKVGVAVQRTGDTLDTVGDVPFVGGRVRSAAQSIQDAGRSTIASGRQSRSSIHDLAWMLDLFVAVIPTVPLLALYLPVRIGAARERRAVRAMLARRGDDPVLRRILAQRALLSMPYHQLLQLRQDAVGDAAGEQTEALAEAELARLGVRDGEQRAGAAR